MSVSKRPRGTMRQRWQRARRFGLDHAKTTIREGATDKSKSAYIDELIRKAKEARENSHVSA